MILDWIYNNPTWMWGSVFVFGAVVLSCLGLTVVHRLVHVELRRAHNDLAGFMFATIGVVYAVLLAFIAIATWEALSSTGTVVRQEAGYIDNLYRDSQGFPVAVGGALRERIKQYTDTVVHEEWPVQMQGEVPQAGWEALVKLHTQLLAFDPETRGQAVIQAEFLRNLNQLYQAREGRLAAATDHIPRVIWEIIIIGAALTTAFTYLFGYEDFRLHLTMTAALAASLTLVIVLIVALDWPLRGDLAVPPDDFVAVEAGWAAGGQRGVASGTSATLASGRAGDSGRENAGRAAR
jgi:hypothetical protein